MLRVKETDRLQAIADEFGRIAPGAVEAGEDSLIIHGGKTPLKAAECQSYADHRIAMSLAVAGTAGAGLKIINPACVGISYPAFYQTLENLTK